MILDFGADDFLVDAFALTQLFQLVLSVDEIFELFNVFLGFFEDDHVGDDHVLCVGFCRAFKPEVDEADGDRRQSEAAHNEEQKGPVENKGRSQNVVPLGDDPGDVGFLVDYHRVSVSPQVRENQRFGHVHLSTEIHAHFASIHETYENHHGKDPDSVFEQVKETGLDADGLLQVGLIFTMRIVVIVVAQPEKIHQEEEDGEEEGSAPNGAHVEVDIDGKLVVVAAFVEDVEGENDQNQDREENGHDDADHDQFVAGEVDFLLVRVRNVHEEGEDQHRNT